MIKGRKLYFIRFLPPNENAERIFHPQEVERFEQPSDSWYSSVNSMLIRFVFLDCILES